MIRAITIIGGVIVAMYLIPGIKDLYDSLFTTLVEPISPNDFVTAFLHLMFPVMIGVFIVLSIYKLFHKDDTTGIPM